MDLPQGNLNILCQSVTKSDFTNLLKTLYILFLWGMVFFFNIPKTLNF